MKKKTSLLLLGSSLALSFLISLGGTKTLGALEATNYDNLKVLLENYYGTGTYTKESNIYVDESKVEEDLTQFFHAKANTTEKVTYYTKDALWMSRENGSYSYYGTSYSDNNGQEPKGLTNATATNPYVTPSAPGIALKGTNQNSMEEYYVTLKDFIEGYHISTHTNNKEIDLTQGWLYANGVYSSTDEDVIDGFRLFTAPLWLGKTDDNANYLTYTKATIQEDESNLVMKLWVNKGESGKLIDEVETDGTDLVFSKAIVSKGQTGENMQKVKNLQKGLGTDFEGYSPDNPNNAMLFDPDASVSAASAGTWYADSNGVKAYAHQSGYKIRLIEEGDNVALKVGGFSHKELFRVGLNLTEEVCEPGTYVAKLKMKRGPEATISKTFFKINNGAKTDSKNPLQYLKDGLSGNSNIAGFFFNNTERTGTELDFELDTEWKEYSTTFTIEEGSQVDKATSVCAAFVMYTSNKSENLEKDYILIDDFEIYRANDTVGYGTDFEGYNSTDHADLFANKTTNGWKEDSNSNKVLGIQSGFNGVRLVEEDGNVAVRIGGFANNSADGIVRAHFDVNDDIKEPGVYKVRIKMKLDENSEAINKIGFRINPKSSTLASSGLTYRTYFKWVDDVIITNEWAVYETDLVVKSDDKVVTSIEDLCMSMYIYTNNNENTEDRGLFVDDLEIYRYSY